MNTTISSSRTQVEIHQIEYRKNMKIKQLTYPTIQEQKQFWIDQKAKLEKIVEDQFNRRLREITGLTGKLADVKLEAQSNNATDETRGAIGAASINIEYQNGIIVVTHGEDGDVLLSRNVKREFWSKELWPLLEGKQS